jgi:hypothetical protein
MRFIRNFLFDFNDSECIPIPPVLARGCLYDLRWGARFLFAEPPVELLPVSLEMFFELALVLARFAPFIGVSVAIIFLLWFFPVTNLWLIPLNLR